ncbi:helix-turn-helix domain-containing protein [Candidatus Pacearchaeota archaeon]|nr:helix-turn-helix domain-containing protein [Candidatus Pacearchaeota archaeon]
MIATLQRIGLTDAEAKVYLALLELGSTTAGPLIKKAELHRATVYDCLKRLIEKGLVSYVVVRKMRYFEAADPMILLNLVKEREEELREILPQLKAKRQIGAIKQEVTVFSGTKGIKTVCENILEELGYNGEYLDFGVSGLFREIMSFYWDIWQKKKKKLKIRSKCIFDEKLKKINPKLLKDYYGEAKFNPHEYSSFTDTIIYKDKVVLFIWTAKPPVAIVIKNKENADSYRNQFRLMWKYAKK